MPVDLEEIIRPNIWSLEPYRCARDDYKEGVLLDANENTHGPALTSLEREEIEQELNRYPDPHQVELKELLCKLRNLDDDEYEPLTWKNLYIGVGSDECIDSAIRIVCTPGKDKALICPPTYGMYTVSAQINDVGVVRVNQDWSVKGQLKINVDEIMDTLYNDPLIKLVFLCSPGNPTGSLIDRSDMEKILNHPTWKGLVVVDEAYIDFAPAKSSQAPLVNKYNNLIVMQTLSKSFGLAGARLGYAFTSPVLAGVFNSMKAPYNVSTPASKLAMRALSHDGVSLMKEYVSKIEVEKNRLIQELPNIPGIGQFVGGTSANFLLVELLDKPKGSPCNVVAKKVYEELAQKRGVVVRFRGSEPGCTGCVRISIGTTQETDTLLTELSNALKSVYNSA